MTVGEYTYLTETKKGNLPVSSHFNAVCDFDDVSWNCFSLIQNENSLVQIKSLANSELETQSFPHDCLSGASLSLS